MNHPFYTIGHSTRTIPDFVALLRIGGVDLVVDIRTVPRSRTNPQYNRDALPAALQPFGIGYEHFAELGGLRGKTAGSGEVNAYWTNASFRNYADYAMSDAFRAGLERLVRLGRERLVAIMCSEAVWWRCHRRIVTDYLLQRGETVFHLMDPDKVEPAKMTGSARPQKDGTIHYPA
jgi:uncharacterized protein (DUF488 family)